MASHIKGCFLVVISSAKCKHSLHLVCIHPHVANIIRSAFPVRAYGDMNGIVECLSHYISTCILFVQFCSTHCYTCRFKLQLQPVSMYKWVLYL